MRELDHFLSNLVRKREEMGAELIQGDSIYKPEPLPQVIPKKGVVIDPGELKPDSYGLFTLNGERVLVHIQDTGNSCWTLERAPEKSKKFHITQCQTLDRMKRENRYERYVATQRTDGLFLVHYRNPDNSTGEIEARLQLCKHCHTKIRWPGSSKDFSIKAFFEKYSTQFDSVPRKRDTDGRDSNYTRDWKVTSQQTRERAGWICSKCNVNLSEHRQLLHVHHRNGVKSDNKPNNLEVLCKLCHRDEFGHSNMDVSVGEEQVIRAARTLSLKRTMMESLQE